MISDVLSDATAEIDRYHANFPDVYQSRAAWINAVKAVMRGLQHDLDTLPIIEPAEMSPTLLDSLHEYLRVLGDRLGMKVVVKNTAPARAEVELVSPSGVPVAGGLVWRMEGRWQHGGFPKLWPEWWTAKERAEAAAG